LTFRCRGDILDSDFIDRTKIPGGMSMLKGFALMMVILALGLPMWASRAEEPGDEESRETPKHDASESSPVPAKEKSAASAAKQPVLKEATTTGELDTAYRDVPADSQRNNLMRIHDIIELHMNPAQKRKFEAGEKENLTGADLEVFYKSVCGGLKILCDKTR
jgi:hypothetical protein